MVYDGYYGRFVPIEWASFDVGTTPEAVVELPLPEEEPQHVRRRRPSGPRCDACRERRSSVQWCRDGLLAICRPCAQGIDVRRLDSAAAIRHIVDHAPAPQRASFERGLLGRRAVRKTRRERKANTRLPAPGDSGSDSPASPHEQV